VRATIGKRIVWALAIVGCSAWLSTASATELLGGRDATLPQGRTVADDLAAAGSNVLVQGRVDGDVMAAGANVTLTGPVQADVMAAGANVSVGGPVGDDLRAAGANVIVSGPVTDNAILAGSTVVLQPGASIGRDASLAGGSVQVQGKVGRNLSIGATEAQLASEVGGSVEAHVERLTLLPGALVRGNLVVRAPAPPKISAQARVLGRVDYRPIAAAEPRPNRWGGWVGWLVQFLWLVVLGTAMLAFSMRWADRVTETFIQQPALSILVGFLGLLLVPVLSVALLITLVGVPLAAVLMALYVVALLLAGAFVAYLVGGALLSALGQRHASPYMRLVLGALLVSVAMALPWVGWLFGLIVLLVGFGALLMERYERLLRLRAEDHAGV
jgi:hypothetical protein